MAKKSKRPTTWQMLGSILIMSTWIFSIVACVIGGYLAVHGFLVLDDLQIEAGFAWAFIPQCFYKAISELL